jgi:hypothetical protein
MNAMQFASELDRALAYARESVSFAKLIETGLREIGPGMGGKRLWRRRISM